MKRNQYIYRKLAFETYGFKKQCEICNSLEKICVHHKDENPGNNSKENLQILCNKCHTRLHSKGNKYCLGYKHTEEARKKISEANFKREYKKGITTWMKGKNHNEESRKKISLSNKGRIARNKGKEMSQDFKNKISASVKLRKLSQETKEKISKGNIGKRSKKVNQYDLNGNFIKTWNSITEIYNSGIKGHIGECCRGTKNKAGGFIWKYFIN